MQTKKEKSEYLFSFRVTESEREKILKKVEDSGLSKSEYLTRSALHQKINALNYPVLRTLTVEMIRQGNNLNQLAKKFNQGHGELERTILDTLQDLRNVYRSVNEVINASH